MNAATNDTECNDSVGIESPEMEVSPVADRLLKAFEELSEDTQIILREFLLQQRERENRIDSFHTGEIPEVLEENWVILLEAFQNLSQFWYSCDTAKCLASECVRLARKATKDGHQGAIACVSTPSVYKELTRIQHGCTAKIFEYDARFSAFVRDFVPYDYNRPLDVPKDFQSSFDVVIADPPYLNDDCIEKTVLTVRFISKPDAKIIFCTGKVMEDLLRKILDLKLQNFEIRHDKERLSNPFGCFANYSLDQHCKYT